MFAATLGAALPLAFGSFPAAPFDAPLPPQFAPPVRLLAGDVYLGDERMYPSPVFHDVNGDGLLDVVVGDLRGRLTVALRVKGADARAFADETELMAADGKAIDFHNW